MRARLCHFNVAAAIVLSLVNVSTVINGIVRDDPLRAMAGDAPVRDDPLRAAVCITGQLARLEMQSKLDRLLLPNLRRGHRLDLFFSLSPGSGGFVNAGDRGEASPHAASRSPWEPLSTPPEWDVEESHVVVGGERIAYRYTEHVPSTTYPLNQTWIEALDKDKATNKDRATKHMHQWKGIRRCMIEVEKAEIARGLFYDLVVRLRDDAFLINDWVLRDTSRVETLDLLNWGGLNDNNYVVPRAHASTLLRGLAEEYYLDQPLDQVETGFENPEQYLRYLAERHAVPQRAVGICDLPAVPSRFRDGEVYPRETTYKYLMGLSKKSEVELPLASTLDCGMFPNPKSTWHGRRSRVGRPLVFRVPSHARRREPKRAAAPSTSSGDDRRRRRKRLAVSPSDQELMKQYHAVG